ncbi:MAG TPA: hypothetical protein VGE97_02950 [Nitrososphaera sp.]
MPRPIPTSIKVFASEIMNPVALVGCRTSEMSLDCCEYDMAIISLSEKGEVSPPNQVVRVANRPVKLIHIVGPLKNHFLDLANMIILKDNDNFLLSSVAKDITIEKYKKMLAAQGKKLLISSLFHQHKMGTSKHPLVAAMWLKIAAYEFMDGLIAVSGNRPMPMHILDQMRQTTDRVMTEAADVVLECIGTERATRPTIFRSLQAIQELKSRDFDRDLFVSKANNLLDLQMLVNCYYYSGKVAAVNLLGRGDLFCNQYTKLVQIALDLASDLQSLEKMQRHLFRETNSVLRS